MRANDMLRRVGYHEEYDGLLIGRLIRLMNSDDLWYDDATDEPGWATVSESAAADLGGAALHNALPDTGKWEQGNPDRMPLGVTMMGMTLVSRDTWFGLIADRLAELIKGPSGMSEEFLVRSLRDATRRFLAAVGGVAEWDDRVALILSDQVIDDWIGQRPR